MNTGSSMRYLSASRRMVVTTALAIAVNVLVAASAIWACVAVFSLTTMSSSVQPGGTVTVIGRGFAQGEPIDIHLDSLTGPILATAPPPNTTMTSQFVLPVTIPENTPVGPHILVAHQRYHDMNAGGPTRTMIHIGTSAPVVPPLEAERPAAVSLARGPSALALAAIGLGTAIVSLLLVVGVATALRPRRTSATAHA
jgi:hypothetical protein